MTNRIPLNVPNMITLGRLAAVPALIFIMIFMDDSSPNISLNKTLSFLSAFLFVIAMSSDMIDGYLARKYNLITIFGKFMDPLADKMLFIVAMIMMIGLDRIPAWIVALFFMREVAVTSLRAIASNEGVVISASHWGKYKSAFVSSATVGMLLHYPFFGVNWKLIGWALLVPSFIFSMASGLHYAIGFFRSVPSAGEVLDKGSPSV
ncbi:MAG TPA: CDP-diacylglycerol--glycerol-3-phosphate 3-phosphatidyltransferase [bacterium]|nr:MAG: CDP-diacylglycerol--glycerol-3-phosphate 3-phosphatidyltransferase [bacterium ADurb.Bin270]HPW45090.1 CDP-diacylglycerol--glycerol-3-phosphate 3-phosphatidyltransferase [bacterium]HQC50508.1 CDP-diacylglycerol--glycerol-3-phosphate 3-phosphatidyltransferase [bacterium]HQH80894.1 CDP-diacylglycerol--glycerol-3-phosphate 3-phosphatidyltransferase [bacterium]